MLEIRLLFTLLGLIIVSNCHTQTNHDTVFLKKEKFGTIYITKDTSIQQYKWLVPKNLSIENISIFNEYFDNLKKDTLIKIEHFNLGKIPSKWCPLYILNNSYFLYGPADWIMNDGFLINDSILVRQHSESPDFMIILDYRQISENEYFFKLLTWQGTVSLTINIIDSTKGIAIWKFTTNNYQYYRLLVNANNVKQFPMVKCDCGETKCLLDYEFESIDFDRLLKKAH